MTLEEKYNNLYKSKMSDRIYNAFKDVKLGDGIGYGEAICKDDYFTPDDPYYIEQKSLDEREDWRNIVKMIEANDGGCGYVHCFMDAKGLRFYLPVLLTLRLIDDSLWLWFSCLFEGKDLKPYKERVELLSILTSEQKQCLLDCFREDFNLRIQQNFEWNTATICCDVHNKIRNPDYTMDQAREYAYAAYEEIYDTANKLEIYFKDLDQVKKKIITVI